MGMELPQLTLQQKWETAEANLVYFIVCGITYARARGQTAADFGTWAGEVAAPSWQAEKSLGPRGLVGGIAANKQQFHGFEMEILDESATRIHARMRHIGDDVIGRRPLHEVSVEEYVQFFDKKWMAIAQSMGLEYRQEVEGEWVVFTVSQP
jgi:hypothetical protein